MTPAAKAALAISFLLTACDPVEPMSNDAIIRETKACHEAGMKAVQFMRGGEGVTTVVQCVPVCQKDYDRCG